MDYNLKCTNCTHIYKSSYTKQICENCGSIIEVVYPKKAPVPKSTMFWDYEKLLPKCDYRRYNLGSTELVQSTEHKNLYLKLELQNPTRSFKDRGSVIEVAKAKEYGYGEIAVASTGNMAYSLAYYAKTEGIKASVFISKNANPDKVRDILMTHDAKMHKVNGDFSKAQQTAARYAARNRAFLSGDYCYRKEGQKTVMYEIAAQLNGITHVIVPVGNATLISGIAKALDELKNNKIKIIAVQASLCSPVVKAMESNKPIRYEVPRTRADAIAVGMPTFGSQAISAIKKTDGCAVAVTDKEMEREQEILYAKEGIMAELAGVASIAAFRKLKFRKSDKIIAIISGGNI